MRKEQKKGFTLIELLVVISVISLLISIVLSALSDAKAKGNDAEKVRSLNETRTALQLYFTDKGYYPDTTAELVPAYIKSIDSGIIYEGTMGNGSLCSGSGAKCAGYHMGVVLTRSNVALNTDKDSTNLFDGKSTDCAGASSGTDMCYDWIQ